MLRRRFLFVGNVGVLEDALGLSVHYVVFAVECAHRFRLFLFTPSMFLTKPCNRI